MNQKFNENTQIVIKEKPEVPDIVQERVPAPITTVNSYEGIIAYREFVMKQPTPPQYIGRKDKFAYLPSKYVDNEFKKWYPVHNVKLVSRTENEYYIHYTVEVSVTFPGGLTMSELGSAGQRKQVTAAAKMRVQEGKGGITPFDYVDNGNTDKAALTLAIKNAQERHGIGADVTQRIILSKEEIEETEQIISAVLGTISHPRDKIVWKTKLAECKSPNDKLALLEEMRELFEVDEIISQERNNNATT